MSSIYRVAVSRPPCGRVVISEPMAHLAHSLSRARACLVCVEDEECHHQCEETSGFGKGKAQNGVREKLACSRIMCQNSKLKV